MDKEIENILQKLSPLERQVLPYLKKDYSSLLKESKLDSVSALRALRFLENKGLIKIKNEKKEYVDLSTNGLFYKKNGLPERKLLEKISEKNFISLEDAKKESKLSDNEFKVSLGMLKSKSLIEIRNGKLCLSSSRPEISKMLIEEKFLNVLPKKVEDLNAEEKIALGSLKKRKEIIELKEEQYVSFELTELGGKIPEKISVGELIEEITPEIIKNWKRGSKFRVYDLSTPAPKIFPGRKHFVNQAIEYGRRIWLDMGFKEMRGEIVQSAFWNFDALFTAQDHPVREMHDTFYLKGTSSSLPDKKLVERVKQCHERGVDGSKGWQCSWNEEQARKTVLRTHTTCLSAKTLVSLKKEDIPAKYFSIGKNLRNETVDWSHLFEFYQTEGIVIDENVTLRHLLGYLKEFYKKMGFENVRFTPSYFPYTEPSVEIAVWNKDKGKWLELGGAGIFRPEITIPLMGFKVPVLAWGQGFERIIVDYYKIKDLREMYSNNLKQLREIKSWMK